MNKQGSFGRGVLGRLVSLLVSTWTVTTQGFAIHILEFYYHLGIIQPRTFQLKISIPDFWTPGGWKFWGWRIPGWKVGGWPLGLKIPGLKCPATFLKSHWMVIFAWWFPKGFELARFGIVHHAFNFRILCNKLIFLQNVFSRFRNLHKTFISHLFFIDLTPYCILFWVDKFLCNRSRFLIC